MDCFHYGNQIPWGDSGYIEISNVNLNKLRTASLCFHGDCFEEAAGKEYIDALANFTYDSRDLTPVEQCLMNAQKKIQMPILEPVSED